VLKCPPGLGSYVHWDRKLDGRLGAALMSIPGVKGVELGAGFAAAELPGSQVQDEIGHDGTQFTRFSNNAGGIEGGVSNGQDIVLRVAMKPIPTLGQPLRTVDLVTKRPAQALKERADVCVVPALGVIGEAVAALEIAAAFSEKFGGDSLKEMQRNYKGYMEQLRKGSMS
jgi:chorismate synthase